MSDRDWLVAAKQGDPIIIYGRLGEDARVGRINRTTKTRIFVIVPPYNIETAFRRTDGRQVGGSRWSSLAIGEGKPDALRATADESKRRKIAAELAHRNWRNCTLATLEAIAAILKPDATKSATTPEVESEASCAK
jgi:hypothetical protein